VSHRSNDPASTFPVPTASTAASVAVLPERCLCWREQPHPPHWWKRILVQPGRVKCPGIAERAS
jgi:hypothetical protein